MTKVKICGLRRVEDVQYVNACRPDYAGFVFADSRRRVTKETAGKLSALLDVAVTPVGVFVNEKPEVITELIREGIIAVAQLHGDEDEAYIRRLKEMCPEAKIIQVVRVGAETDVRQCADTQADYLLFDTFSVKEYGGTGETFDWSLLKDVKKPFFLAGGISSANVEEACRTIHPYAVDVSSDVETDGYKDREKIAELVAKVKEQEG